MPVVILTFLVFLQFWAGITPMVRCSLRLRSGAGGGVRPIMVLDGTAWVTMVVAYMLWVTATTSAALGSMCAVSRLHKLITVYSFYSYWRIKN